MSLQGFLSVPDCARRRLVRFPLALARLSSAELNSVRVAYGDQNLIQSAAAKLRGGWWNDASSKSIYNASIIAAQESINELVTNPAFKAKLDATDVKCSDDWFAFVMHAGTDALVYEKGPETTALIGALFGRSSNCTPGTISGVQLIRRGKSPRQSSMSLKLTSSTPSSGV